jgi:threonine/homoserine/homoserine lactone efflux protein
MISPALYAAFVGATIVLMLIPGPNVALIVATSLSRGPRAGLLTVAGTASAMVVQLALVALGVATLLAGLGRVFEVLRLIGVAYLVYLAIRAWRAPAPEPALVRPPSGPGAALRGFLVSLVNPKTLAFYVAFLPQFIDRGGDVGRQTLALGVTFVAIAIVVDSGWALMAARLGGWLKAGARVRNRVAAVALLGAGVGLALARRV